MFYSEGARCCCKHGIAWIWIDVVVVTTALIVEGFYLAQSDDAVLFVIVLRLVRICNGLFQQVRQRQLAKKVLGSSQATSGPIWCLSHSSSVRRQFIRNQEIVARSLHAAEAELNERYLTQVRPPHESLKRRWEDISVGAPRVLKVLRDKCLNRSTVTRARGRRSAT
jgi:hypothetical protein